MTNKIKLITLGLALSSVALSANNTATPKKAETTQKTTSTTDKAGAAATNLMGTKKNITEDMITNKKGNSYDLNFDSTKYTTKTATVNGKNITYRAYENIVYVKNPVDIQYQTINIYIPEEYFNNQSVGKYNANTAPIFMPNSIGGYMPGAAIVLGNGRDGNPDASLTALSHGYVVASPGARGRTLSKDGKYTGKAPAFIVDQKAAIRYIHFNDKKMPGRADRIITNGTSAGGATSVLIGATGNSKDYESYLKELGAANASDAIFAVSAYCPITNLDNANTAYEWMFNKVTDYQKIEISMLDYNVERKTVAGKLTEEEIKISNELKAMFPDYVNSLKLKDKNGKALTLDKNGNGTFKDYVKQLYIESANVAISKGTDVSKVPGVKMENGKVTDLDFDEYVAFMGRMKTPGAFDNVTNSTGENNEFGDAQTDNKHFTKYMFERSTVNGKMADAQIIKMLNPMYYIETKNATVAKHWRIRHGAVDKDTSLAIPAILALKLQNLGYDVDFASPWATPHSGDYDLTELFAWADKIVAENK